MSLVAERVLDVPGINFLWKVGNLYLGGSPSAVTLDVLAKKGVKQVFNLKSIGESDITGDEKLCKDNGIEYHHIPALGPMGLDPAGAKSINDLINKDAAVLVHCASGNRVAGWLITYLVQKEGMDFEAAVELAQNAGLRTVDFIYQAEEIINS